MRISIVTPSFRQVDYLKRCAASVADQAGSFAYEHLIQDGMSGEAFEEWARRQNFADVVSEADDGMYDAINRGFGRAKGEILAWLNCDEQYLPGALAAVDQWFSDHPECDVLFGDVVLVSAAGDPISYRQAVVPWLGHTRNCFLASYSAATFVRRRVIQEGFHLSTEYRMISDAVWICGLLERGYRCGVLNRPLATFTQTGENMGQQAAGFAEGARWRRRDGWWRKLRSAGWSAAHRARKMLNGSYRSRDVEIEVYLGDDGRRSTKRGRISGRWQNGSK
jgi:glycosyltransferase involved in cell wall biosynthesis